MKLAIIGNKAMEVNVIIKETKTGNIIAKLSGPDFMKHTRTPMTVFLTESVETYNKNSTSQHAEIEYLVRKRNKWVAI